MKPKPNYHHGDLRSALLIAAEQELTEKGVEGFSLRGVAKRAGVSHGAPAHHFEDTNGLLTELAAVGHQRFIQTQLLRQQNAAQDPESQLAASGLGYIDFATQNPALFRLMFSSDRPDKDSPVLLEGANLAFEKLVNDVAAISKTDPHSNERVMTDVAAVWSMAHGLADLLISKRFNRFPFFTAMGTAQKETLLSELVLRACSIKSQQPQRSETDHAPAG